MTKQTLTRMAMALALLVSLLVGVGISAAQPPPELSEAFSWQPYGLAVQYPARWTVSERPSAVSFAPAGRDVSDGFGPELVLFDQPNTTAADFESTVADFAASSGAKSQITARTTLNGLPVVRANLNWGNPAASGAIMLVAAKPDTALGAAYVVRDADAGEYAGTLAAMFDSVALDIANARTSVGVTSVQLPQIYAWEDTGLLLHFPAAWVVEIETGSDGEMLYAAPDDSGSVVYGIFATTFPRESGLLTLDLVANSLAMEFDEVLDQADITVAGYEGKVYDVRDVQDGEALIARLVALDLADRDSLAVVVLAADADAWDDFRPTVSAIISNIEAAPVS